VVDIPRPQGSDTLPYRQESVEVVVPVYNEEKALPESIPALCAYLETYFPYRWSVVIADNASTDGTAALVEEYRRRLGRVRYFRWEANQGADRNYLKAVELASGGHCWILGSDDPIADGAIARVRALIAERKPTIVLFNRLLCTSDLTPIREDRFLPLGEAEGARFDFSIPGTLERYLEDARSMCATFSYLSSMVFLKRAWDAVSGYEDFLGTAYVHSYKLLVACARGAVLDAVCDRIGDLACAQLLAQR